MELALVKIDDEVLVPANAKYIAEVRDILENKSFQSMKAFVQHGITSCLTHCITVSYQSYLTCEKYGLDSRAAARAGLLHDLFLYDWHTNKAETGKGLHGFFHPHKALENAKKEFCLTPLEEEIILKHMWPLTLVPPKSKEAYVVLYHDKICSLREICGKPSAVAKVT